MSEQETKNENVETEEEVSEVEQNEEEVVELSEKELLENEVASLKDTYARVHADFENVKKRLEREKYQALEYANEKFAKDLIPVIDALDGAIASTNVEADAQELLEKVMQGVELTKKQLLSALDKHGVTPVEEDEPFDPNIHNAVQKVDSEDHESGQIVQTFQKGYKYKERTLRDAMVVIAN
ncbi:MAG: nucleotide exchange factor GrpE [Campylobacterota bacterium]|nr:nucleotide exchange factor GrpE [Campylobacterota bacterium]